MPPCPRISRAVPSGGGLSTKVPTPQSSPHLVARDPHPTPPPKSQSIAAAPSTPSPRPRRRCRCILHLHLQTTRRRRRLQLPSLACPRSSSSSSSPLRSLWRDLLSRRHRPRATLAPVFHPWRRSSRILSKSLGSLLPSHLLVRINGAVVKLLPCGSGSRQCLARTGAMEVCYLRKTWCAIWGSKAAAHNSDLRLQMKAPRRTMLLPWKGFRVCALPFGRSKEGASSTPQSWLSLECDLETQGIVWGHLSLVPW